MHGSRPSAEDFFVRGTRAGPSRATHLGVRIVRLGLTAQRPNIVARARLGLRTVTPMLASIARRTRLRSPLVAGALLLATVGLSASGCTLVTDVDRSKIPPESAPPSPTADAGGQEPPPAEDSGAEEPPPEPTPDAAVVEDAATEPEVPVDSGVAPEADAAP